MTSFYDDKVHALELAEELSQVNCQDDLEFAYLFEYEPPSSDFPGENRDEPGLSTHKVLSSPGSLSYTLEDTAGFGLKSCSPSYSEPNPEGLPDYESFEAKGFLGQARPSGAPALSPRIEITPSREHYIQARDSLQGQLLNTSPRQALTVPGQDSLAYREPACLSPASSNSSTSWHSESYSPWASPCVSPSNGQTAGDLCPRFQGIQTSGGSPGTSPRASLTEDCAGGPRSPSSRPGSRSTSPQGKRTYHMYRNPGLVAGPRSRSPSPHAAHDHHHHPSAVSGGVHYGSEVINGFNVAQPSSVPTKIIRTTNSSQGYGVYPEAPTESYVLPCQQDVKTKPESFYVIPPAIWTKQLPAIPGICSIPVASLPPLEWPLPSRTDQYELYIEVQPKPHHRAHYETEGSRGAVKAPTGGHPVVQLHGGECNMPLGLQIFIGTADERILKPHAFYQVHRITGKTVTTSSYEKIISSTKVLEIPLEPKNNMKAIIDCAGILKLRNADIELRKGETDIGRKNTRVRLVFRVHIPQANGQHVSLQVASHPIECSQRSAHELPMVEKQDLDGCSVLGGQQMILTGQNFSSDSKVIFTEKTPDGQQIWEVEATVDKDKSQTSMLFIELPAFRDPSICHPVKVNFYVINGKRKRSQPQHFTYTPLPVASIKTEPVDEYERHMAFGLPQLLGVTPQYYHSPRTLVTHDPSLASCQQARPATAPGLDPHFQQQSPAIVYSRGAKSASAGPSLYPQASSTSMHPDPHRSVLVHTGSPSQHGHTHTHGHPHAHTHSSIIQFSSTHNQLLRATEPLAVAPEQQHVLYGDPPHSQHYPTVIQQQQQQQAYTPKMPKSSSPSSEEQSPSAPARVTVKQENLDQAYLDDVNEIIRKDLTGVHGRGQT
ncbi:nuclear factor of activated T-cells, cytoplasmic 2 [Alosa sapidissima]|uniref:nuclear factor of activated T-cells, cytoplasmic 2 n=1 Tax=Alosa sapidissima TaxID=34773 RepID=UPI001C09CAF2|nr:nuclear factor of activated T-cells, cytoplasmic 2 [Alosa sapidissima]